MDKTCMHTYAYVRACVCACMFVVLWEDGEKYQRVDGYEIVEMQLIDWLSHFFGSFWWSNWRAGLGITHSAITRRSFKAHFQQSSPPSPAIFTNKFSFTFAVSGLPAFAPIQARWTAHSWRKREDGTKIIWEQKSYIFIPTSQKHFLFLVKS